MQALLAVATVVALGVLILLSVIQFCETLYRKKSFSIMGLVTLVCALVLMYRVHDMTQIILHYASELAKYQIVELK